MSNDYIESQRAAAINRGQSDSPASLAKAFGSHNSEYRAQILDAIAKEESNEPIGVEDAKAFLERRSYVQTLRRTHAVLRKHGR
jgi:hypothetical protein